jgi:DNA-binding NtrC family response regulator
VKTLREAVEAFEREYLQRALDKAGGHRAVAAELLGISRKSLWQKLRAYGLQAPRHKVDIKAIAEKLREAP